MREASHPAHGSPHPIDALLTVAHQALVQAASARTEADGARAAQDPELANFLDEVREQALDLAGRCKSLLSARLAQSPPRSAEQRVEEASEQSFPASDAPAY